MLVFIKILSSTILNNILSSSSLQIFVFLILTFVGICQNEVLSEEMSGNIAGGNFPVGNFPGGSLMSRKLPRTF